MRLAFWLAWIALIVRPVYADVPALRNVARLVTEIAAVILMAAGGYWTLRIRPANERGRARRAGLVMLLFVVPAAVYGLARGNNITAWSLFGFFPYMTALLIVLGSVPRVVRELEETVFWQLAFGIVFIAYVLIFHPPQTRAEWTGDAGVSLAAYAYRTVYGLPFLLPTLHRMAKWRRAVVVLAWGGYLAMGITGEHRGLTLVGLMTLPLGVLYISFRRRDGGVRKLLGAALLVVLLLTLVGTVTGRGRPMLRYLDGRWEQTASRLSGTDDDEFTKASRATVNRSAEEFTGERGRGGELRDFVRQTDVLEFLIGRGFGGTWYSYFWGLEWAIVHFGPAHLVLQGGVLLLLAFVGLMFFALRRGSKDMEVSDQAAGAALFLVVFLQGWLQHGAIADQIEVYFMWICVGIALSGRFLAVEAEPPAPTRAHWLVRRRRRGPSAHAAYVKTRETT